MIDTNIHLSRYPTRRLPFDETPRLVQRLKSAAVTQAWAGSFDGLLHKDIGGVNQRLHDECAAAGEEVLLPFGSVNPTLPDWQEDVRRCAEDYEMPGIRLHPNYHGYTLDDERFKALLDLAGRYHLIVQVVIKMEDERTQHRLLRVDPVDASPLITLVQSRPKLVVVLLNALRSVRGDTISQLTANGNVFVEISMQEGVGGITKLLKHAPLDRVLFGSHFPFFNLESAQLKLRESELAQFQLTAITSGNAQRLLDSRND